MIHKTFISIIILFLFASCQRKNENLTINRGLFYWKSAPNYLKTKEEKLLNDLNINKLYVKFFEVDDDSVFGFVPISKTN